MKRLREDLDLLILDQLTLPFARAKSLLTEVKTALANEALPPATIAGLYALAISQIDASISDAFRYVLKRNPWKMTFAEIPVKRDEALSVELVREILETHADRLIREWSYGSKPTLLERFMKVLELNRATLDNWPPQLAKLRGRRNEILHQPPPDGELFGRSIPWVTQVEAERCLDQCLSFLADVLQALKARYASHTRVAALRRLWEYLFDSPIMCFEDYWVIDDARDKVVALKDCPLIDQLATSERMLLGVWRAEFAREASLLVDFNMKRLDRERQRDLITLLAALREIWLY